MLHLQEAGYSFIIDKIPQVKYGTISVVPADNLASNVLGGFKEGSTAHRGCRHCLATPVQIASFFDESLLELRNHTDHLLKCNELDNAITARERNEKSTEFGINHSSVLDELIYFNVCSGGLIQDVMHDVLEGMCMNMHNYSILTPQTCIGMLEYETKELIRQHINIDGYYTLDYLNQQIRGTELGYMEVKDRPSVISLNTLHSNDHKLKQEGM